jgi:hypothetical protein
MAVSATEPLAARQRAVSQKMYPLSKSKEKPSLLLTTYE